MGLGRGPSPGQDRGSGGRRPSRMRQGREEGAGELVMSRTARAEQWRREGHSQGDIELGMVW
jgi:hypothetical protein